MQSDHACSSLRAACFTNPLALETGDLLTHRDRGSEDSARYPPDNSPFLRYSFPARLSLESRPQGRLFISINFSTITSVISIRRPPHREQLRERLANWTERCWCFLHEFLDVVVVVVTLFNFTRITGSRMPFY